MEIEHKCLIISMLKEGYDFFESLVRYPFSETDETDRHSKTRLNIVDMAVSDWVILKSVIF